MVGKSIAQASSNQVLMNYPYYITLCRASLSKFSSRTNLAVDTLGFPFFSHSTKASVSDDRGLIEMLSDNIDYFKSKPVNIPKITILLDNGYHPPKLI